ncbi:MAG: response regulator [Chloroflexota bacterium]
MTTVLLVDDEKLVLRSLEKTLLRAGYEVLTATDCPSGSQVFAENIGQVDIAILDLNMPDFQGQSRPGSGLDLLADLKKQKPALPVVILTAYDEVNKAKDSVSGGASAFFVKGREQGLVELIETILADRQE